MKNTEITAEGLKKKAHWAVEKSSQNVSTCIRLRVAHLWATQWTHVWGISIITITSITCGWYKCLPNEKHKADKLNLKVSQPSSCGLFIQYDEWNVQWRKARARVWAQKAFWRGRSGRRCRPKDGRLPDVKFNWNVQIKTVQQDSGLAFFTA